MLKKIILLFLFIFVARQLPAQNAAFKVTTGNKGKTDEQIVVTFIPNSKLVNGFFLHLPNGIKASLIAVRLNGRSLWLKESDTKPLLKNTLHWQWQDGGFLIDMQDNTLTPNVRLELTLQTAKATKGKFKKEARIAVFSVKTGTKGKRVPGREIAGQTLPDSSGK